MTISPVSTFVVLDVAFYFLTGIIFFADTRLVSYYLKNRIRYNLAARLTLV